MPGYLALHLHRVQDVVLLLGVALAAWAVTAIWGNWAILYGRRRTATLLLVGGLISLGMRQILPSSAVADGAAVTLSDAGLIGFILPGLTAVGIDRHGIRRAVGGLLLTAVLVRLLLIVGTGGEPTW